jgi:hypothetical protein
MKGKVQHSSPQNPLPAGSKNAGRGVESTAHARPLSTTRLVDLLFADGEFDLA